MKNSWIMKKPIIILMSLLLLVFAMVLYAYRGTWGKTDIEFKIHINEKLVQESTYGESPTFAIWLEDPSTGMKKSVFVTRRAAEGDWEGKAEVPVALPLWFEVYKIENETSSLPSYKKPASDAISGATPQPGYFITRARVPSGSRWICWIEVNLSGDYNDHYQEYDAEMQTEDIFGTGQPALLYKAEIEAVEDITTVPEIAGMSLKKSPGDPIIQPLEGITTAKNIFDEISIMTVKPNPKIISDK
jgi:hypothetical protein